jgi:hypothetical protein
MKRRELIAEHDPNAGPKPAVCVFLFSQERPCSHSSDGAPNSELEPPLLAAKGRFHKPNEPRQPLGGRKINDPAQVAAGWKNRAGSRRRLRLTWPFAVDNSECCGSGA